MGQQGDLLFGMGGSGGILTAVMIIIQGVYGSFQVFGAGATK